MSWNGRQRLLTDHQGEAGERAQMSPESSPGGKRRVRYGCFLRHRMDHRKRGATRSPLSLTLARLGAIRSPNGVFAKHVSSFSP